MENIGKEMMENISKEMMGNIGKEFNMVLCNGFCFGGAERGRLRSCDDILKGSEGSCTVRTSSRPSGCKHPQRELPTSEGFL